MIRRLLWFSVFTVTLLLVLGGCNLNGNGNGNGATTYTLAISTSGSGSGSVARSPSLSQYEENTQVKLTVMPDAGSSFVAWSGDVTGTSNPTSITMTSNKRVNAEFSAVDLAGVVVDSIGGAGVSGVTVEIAGTGLSTSSDADGSFSIDGIPAGTYDILASKSGRAGSKRQGVTILSGQGTSIDMVQPLYDFAAALVTPPTISATGVAAGQTYTGTVSIAVSATAGSNPVIGTGSHPSLMIAIGNNADTQNYLAFSGNDTLNYSWNTANYPPGDTEVVIVAYDNNNNRSELRIPVTVGPSSGTSPAAAPASSAFNISAVTTGQSLRLYSRQPEDRIPPGMERRSKILSSEVDSSVYVSFMFFSLAGNDGVVIYRSASETGVFHLTKQVAASIVLSFGIYDTSSALTPGQSVWYKLAYYNQYGIGPQTSAMEVPILPKYTLTLDSPTDNTVISDRTPTLTWSSGTISGADRFERVYWREVNSGAGFSFYILGLNQPQQYTTPLLDNGKEYEWYVSSEYFIDSGDVESISLPGQSREVGMNHFSVKQ